MIHLNGYWHNLIRPVAVLAATLVAGYALKRLLFKGLAQWGARRRTHIDIIIRQSLDGPIMIWTLILGVHLAIQASVIPDRYMTRIATGLLVLWIISLTLMASRLAGNIIKYYGSEIPGALPVTALTQTLAQLAVFTLGLLILLNLLGISITPILTAFGVGGLAIALALQDTLSNLFGGFYLTLAGQVRLGDYIKLNTGEEGYVSDVTWRSTTIRGLSNNLIIVPNAKLAQAIVTNYYLPDTRVALNIPVSVSFDCDPDQIERVLLEEASSGAGVIPGLLTDPPPVVRLIPGFGSSSLGITLTCYVREFADQFLVQHEMRKRILKRFRQEGIELPIPAQAIHLGNCP